MTVNLTRIYTRLGDDGETHLGDMSRVPKTHPRIEAYDCGDDVNRECVRYLNRLSDLLFILSRGANGGDEPLWEPGKYR
jgi:cob(I)alamin adenosyltransferase